MADMEGTESKPQRLKQGTISDFHAPRNVQCHQTKAEEDRFHSTKHYVNSLALQHCEERFLVLNHFWVSTNAHPKIA